jgi:hypothetical protein
MQISAKGLENRLMIMVLDFFFKLIQIQKVLFPFFYFKINGKNFKLELSNDDDI